MMVNTLVLGFLFLLLWQLLRRFFFRTVLDNVPGPSPTSFWAGERRQSFKFVGSMHLLTLHENPRI